MMHRRFVVAMVLAACGGSATSPKDKPRRAEVRQPIRTATSRPRCGQLFAGGRNPTVREIQRETRYCGILEPTSPQSRAIRLPPVRVGPESPTGQTECERIRGGAKASFGERVQCAEPPDIGAPRRAKRPPVHVGPRRESLPK